MSRAAPWFSCRGSVANNMERHPERMIPGAITLILLLFLIALARWQQRIAARADARVEEEMATAREQGTDRPLAQFPRIDTQRCMGCGSCVAACPEEGVLALVAGKAQVVHGSHCVGHASCEEACPIDAIQVGLDTSKRPDLPVLSEQFETSVPGLYVAGELGGYALIRVATAQGIRAVDAIAEELERESATENRALNVLIVGAGPAGIAASLRCRERGLEFLTVDREDVGGTVRRYPRRKLTLTGKLELPLFGEVAPREFLKEDLIAFWETLIERYQIPLRTNTRVTSLQPDSSGFVAETSAGVVAAQRVILALGRQGNPRRLGVPGEELAKVQNYLVDAGDHRGEHVLVVGGGDSAIEAAMALADQPGNRVTLAYRGERLFRLRPRNRERFARYADRVDVRFGTVVECIDDDSVLLAPVRTEEAQEPIDTGDGRGERIRNDAVFICAGGSPPHEFLRACGIALGGDSEPTNDTPARTEEPSAEQASAVGNGPLPERERAESSAGATVP